ncbi:MAG: SGNH/GDSL hydrolase family protein [Clostridia bacterium]|nr:SGNH/GDSL hydrolase family protein [Clostridia bacterium]
MQKKELRILFVGNSITWHPVKQEIGWNHEWGMAASSEKCDYLHLVMREIKKIAPMCVYKIAWVVQWEQEYWIESNLEAHIDAAEFKPDVIILKIGENVFQKYNNAHPFHIYFKKLIDFLNPEDKARVLVATSFWKAGVVDEAMRKIAVERKYPLVELGGFGDSDDMKAKGLFEHKGVGNHPGDRGMEAIANAILGPLKSIIGEISARQVKK